MKKIVSVFLFASFALIANAQMINQNVQYTKVAMFTGKPIVQDTSLIIKNGSDTLKITANSIDAKNAFSLKTNNTPRWFLDTAGNATIRRTINGNIYTIYLGDSLPFQGGNAIGLQILDFTNGVGISNTVTPYVNSFNSGGSQSGIFNLGNNRNSRGGVRQAIDNPTTDVGFLWAASMNTGSGNAYGVEGWTDRKEAVLFVNDVNTSTDFVRLTLRDSGMILNATSQATGTQSNLTADTLGYIRIESSNEIRFITDSLVIIEGNQGTGKVLTSDANGLAAWQYSSTSALDSATIYALAPTEGTQIFCNDCTGSGITGRIVAYIGAAWRRLTFE